MKQIYSMGKGKYVTLDSYHASPETLGSKILMTLFVVIIASITGAAMVGVDMLQLPTQHQQ